MDRLQLHCRLSAVPFRYKLEKQLDANLYSEDDLIELKLAINLPYQTNSADYERYDGEVEYDGVIYKYVKRKVYNDTLYLKCLPNVNKMSQEYSNLNYELLRTGNLKTM